MTSEQDGQHLSFIPTTHHCPSPPSPATPDAACNIPGHTTNHSELVDA